MANILKIGTLYLNGQPTEVGAEYQPSEAISLGQAVPGKEIRWVAVNGMLIADRCILYNVSWDNLNAQDLVFGREVAIDGLQYTARCLKAGSQKGTPNEWDAALDAVGAGNLLWHWEGTFFWGQDTSDGYASHRTVRGYRPARCWNYFSTTHRYAYIGFRPVLVPLVTELDKSMIGRRVAVWAGQSIVHGILDQVTDYDLVLSDWNGTGGVDADSSHFSKLSGTRLAIDRSSGPAVQAKTQT